MGNTLIMSRSSSGRRRDIGRRSLPIIVRSIEGKWSRRSDTTIGRREKRRVIIAGIMVGIQLVEKVIHWIHRSCRWIIPSTVSIRSSSSSSGIGRKRGSSVVPTNGRFRSRTRTPSRRCWSIRRRCGSIIGAIIEFIKGSKIKQLTHLEWKI